MFFKCVHKLKQCTNLRLHDKTKTSFVVSFTHPQIGGRGGVLILNFDRYEGHLFEEGASSSNYGIPGFLP